MIYRYLLTLIILLCAINAQASDLVLERGWVEDPSGTMTLAEAKQAKESPLATKLFSKGYSQSAFWLRLRIEPSLIGDPSVQQLIVRIRPPYQDQIWIYDPLATKDTVRVTGDYYDWADDEYRSLNLNFVIPVGTEPRDIWFRIKASVSTLTFIEVMTPEQVRAADRKQEIITMLFLSALFVCFGWAVLTRINRTDKLLSFYLIRETVVIVYALAILGYLRIFSSGWLPPAWIDQLTNLIAFTFITTLIWFDWQLIREFKPNRWIARMHGSLVLFFPIAVVLMLMGKTNEAARLSSLVVAAYMLLAISSVVSTQAWKQARHAPQEEQPICSKAFLVLIYGLAISIAFLHRLPIMGASSGNDLFFYFNLVYPLLTSITLMFLIQKRLYRLSQNQQEKSRRLALVEIEVAQERAQREEQANFLKMLAHEMKTPLSVVRMAVGGTSLPTKTHEVVERAVTDMDSIIERLLQVERLEDERIDIQLQDIDLLEMVNSLCLSIPEGERIHRHAQGELSLQSDPQLVRVILSNLLENALKYSPPASPVMMTLTGDLTKVRIEVENTVGSAGFPDPQQVFSKYYRSALAHQRTGSGLGLYLVQSLVKLLGGSVSYEAKAQGARFMLDIPAQK
ncbi:ATP-binding protein [Zwartia sp.]|uniref:ATP-binding protein n=1 Tax=Zwartia sp. TaxID=2978004 RepID=UPI003BB12209